MSPTMFAILCVVLFFTGGMFGLRIAHSDIKKSVIPRWKRVLRLSIGILAISVIYGIISMDPWASFASGALYSAFQLGIILGFAERKKLLKRNLCVESVVSHTFENGKLSAGITPDRCGQLRFSVDDDCTITVPFHYRNTKSATDRGLVRYDGGAIIRIGELAALPMLSLHTVYGDDKEKRPPKPLHLVRIKTFTYKWGRVNGIPFVVEGTTEVVRGRARLLCRSKYLINKEWEPWAEDALWLMHDDAILHITDTSGRGFIMWYDYHQGLQCAELL